jgi:hypothetical protein
MNHLISKSKVVGKRISNNKKVRVSVFRPEGSGIKLYKSTIPLKPFLMNTSSRNFTTSLMKTTIREEDGGSNTHRSSHTKRTFNSNATNNVNNSVQLLRVYEIEKKFGILSSRKKKVNATIE